ncbi:MAG: sigma 54-interacting transcriptional regulator [Acidobacteriota bacterium]
MEPSRPQQQLLGYSSTEQTDVVERGDQPDLILRGRQGDRTYRFLLVDGGNRVGSHQENAICLDVPGISQRHAVLRRQGSELLVEDLASKNGTYVNGSRVQISRLEVGDRVRFAALSLRVDRVCAEDRLAISLDAWRTEAGESAHRETTSIKDRAAAPRAEECSGLIYPPSWLPGTSPAMANLLATVVPLVDSELPVLLLGETGTGKEGVARTIHLSSLRASASFVAINCAAIPEELLEAELFGIGRGVATGVSQRPGRFVEARGGTLFLDEIGDMPPALQAKLLRVLQEGQVQPLGQQPRPLEARIITATHSDLAAAMVAGRFRRDLFYRIAGAVVDLPPLRRRRQDIPGLVAHFLALARRRVGKDVRGFTEGAMRLATEHAWPGNVRELQHAVERWVHRCPLHQVIDGDLVESDLASAVGDLAEGPSDVPGAPEQHPDVDDFDPRNLASLDLASIEGRLIREALSRCEGNLTHAAALLGLSRQALRRRMARHGLRGNTGG